MIGSYPKKTDPELRAIPAVKLTSSREERHLLRSYNPDMNAYVVKAMRCHGFFEAIKEVGPFWGVANRPPVKGEWRR